MLFSYVISPVTGHQSPDKGTRSIQFNLKSLLSTARHVPVLGTPKSVRGHPDPGETYRYL